MNKLRKIIFTIIFSSLLIIVTVSILEITVKLLLENPSVLKGGLLNNLRTYYIELDREIIQYQTECSKYDKELAYTLKPGKCHIKNREFEVDYFMNREGVRDDDASLVSPEIIVVGDSHGMGWGVSQDQIFSSRLEDSLERSVLNTAISSYGTVRELKILERINLKGLKYLIIQYCDNDYWENSSYAKNGNELSIMPKEKYNLIRKNHVNNIRYYFGKHSLNLVLMLFEKITAPNGTRKSIAEKEDLTTDEVNVFLNAILNSPVDLTNVEIIVFEVNGHAVNDSSFINKLNETLLEHSTNPVMRNIQTINLSQVLGKDKYFILDDHINSSGHQAIADAISRIINERP